MSGMSYEILQDKMYVHLRLVLLYGFLIINKPNKKIKIVTKNERTCQPVQQCGSLMCF